MATEKQINKFINEIAPLARSAYRLMGKVKPSVCCGVACCESSYGTAKLMRVHQSYFGMKPSKSARKYWSGRCYDAKTKEEYIIGTHTTILSSFRAYGSMQESVLNFYELLTTVKRYEIINAKATYRKQMEQIKMAGYMTSSTEVETVIRIIEKHGLMRFDSNAKTLSDVVKEVKDGIWGNGEVRKNALTLAGWDAEEVQAAVNKSYKRD
jgi:flagellum-specific peptidoglycan hydrolase FlgJ